MTLFRIRYLWLLGLATLAPIAAAQAPEAIEPEAVTEGEVVVIDALGQVTESDAPTTPPLPAGDRIGTGTMRMLRTLETFHRDVASVHAQFIQTRIDEAFQDEIESRGELWFAKPDRFRCDYADPTPTINLILQRALYVYVEELEQVDVWRFASEREREQQLHHLLIGFGFEAEKLAASYHIRSSEDDDQLRLRVAELGKNPEEAVLFIVEPREHTLETSPFIDLELMVDKSRMLPIAIEYHDPTGALMRLRMETIELDAPMPAELFDPRAVFPDTAEWVDRQEIM